MIVTTRVSHCFSSLIWISRIKSIQKSRFSRIVKNPQEISLLDLNLEAFRFHFSLLEKEWKLFVFTFHFSNFKNPLSLVPVTNGTKETLGLRDTQPKGIAFLSCEDNMLAIMANTKRLFTQVVSSISYTMQSNNPLGLFVIFLIQVPTIAFRQLRELDHVNLNQVTPHMETHSQSFAYIHFLRATKIWRNQTRKTINPYPEQHHGSQGWCFLGSQQGKNTTNTNIAVSSKWYCSRFDTLTKSLFVPNSNYDLKCRWRGWRCTTTRSTRSTPTPSTVSPSRWRALLAHPCFPSFSASTWARPVFWGRSNGKASNLQGVPEKTLL